MQHWKWAVLPLAGSLAIGDSAMAAEPRGVAYVGATGGQASAGLAGLILPLPGSRLGKGWAVRAAGSIGQYDYAQGATNIHGDFGSGQLGLVHQASGDWGYLNISAGPSYTKTRLKPVDPANPRRGGHWDGFVETDGGLKASALQVDWSAAYAVGQQNYDTSLDATVKLGRLPVRTGVIGLASGDPTYSSRGVGGLVAVTPKPGLGVNLIGGSMDIGNGKSSGFGVLVLSKAFGARVGQGARATPLERVGLGPIASPYLFVIPAEAGPMSPPT